MNEGQYDSKNVEHISIENIEVVSNEMDWKSRHLEAEKRKAEIRDRIHKQTEQGQKSAKDYFRPAKPTPSIYDSDLKRVAVYARVSTSSEEQISSIENQTLYYTKKIAETENWNLQDIYSDEGKSGTSLRKRDAFKRMMRDAKDQKMDLIICASISRFARNFSDCMTQIAALKTMHELPPRTQFSMLNKPAVSIKYGVMKFNMACIRLFEGIKYVLPILHPNKKRLALIMCPEEDSASVEWARQKDANWVNKDITSLEFVENIFKLMNWNRECRYKVLGRVANSDQGLCMLFDLEEAIMFTPKPQEYTDPLTGEMKKKQIKFFPDVYKDRIGKSYNDYIAGHQMNLFEDFIGYQGSAVLDEPEQKTDTISVPIPQCEESENIPLSDFPEQPENVQRPGSEVVEKGMLT